MATVRELYKKGISLLQGFPQGPLDAKVLLLRCACLSEEEFISSPGRVLSGKIERRYERWLSLRRSGMPLAYILGYREFWSLPFELRRKVFIPRPETELLVEKVLELSSRREEILLDVGTGCGNIALSLAKELPRAMVIGCDISRKSLSLAQSNQEKLGLKNVKFVHGDAFAALKKLELEGKCAFVVSNPPYVSEKEWEKLPEEIKKYESKRALVPGKTGLEFIARLIRDSQLFLKPKGYVLFEVGKGQVQAALSLFNFSWEEVSFARDLAGIPRVVISRKK